MSGLSHSRPRRLTCDHDGDAVLSMLQEADVECTDDLKLDQIGVCDFVAPPLRIHCRV